MADMVQFRLEQMSDELDDLEHRGLFTSAELAEVVRRRRDFEFRLRRHSPHKDDFLDYIAYLLRVDALRDLRKRAIIRAMPDPARSKDDNDDGRGEDGKKRKRKRRKEKWAKSVSVSAGVRRVLDVYRMATVRFKGDLDLWFRYLEFCRQKGHGRMKQNGDGTAAVRAWRRRRRRRVRALQAAACSAPALLACGGGERDAVGGWFGHFAARPARRIAVSDCASPPDLPRIALLSLDLAAPTVASTADSDPCRLRPWDRAAVPRPFSRRLPMALPRSDAG